MSNESVSVLTVHSQREAGGEGSPQLDESEERCERTTLLRPPGSLESVVQVGEEQQDRAGQAEHQQGEDGAGGGAGEGVAAGEAEPGQGGEEAGQDQQVEHHVVLAAPQAGVDLQPGEAL